MVGVKLELSDGEGHNEWTNGKWRTVVVLNVFGTFGYVPGSVWHPPRKERFSYYRPCGW